MLDGGKGCARCPEMMVPCMSRKNDYGGLEDNYGCGDDKWGSR